MSTSAADDEELSASRAMINSLGAIGTEIRAQAHRLPKWRPAPIQVAVIRNSSDLHQQVYDLWIEAFGPA